MYNPSSDPRKMIHMSPIWQTQYYYNFKSPITAQVCERVDSSQVLNAVEPTPFTLRTYL